MLPKPYYKTDFGILYHGDCLDILPHLEPVDLVLSDPVWGTKTKCNAQRFTRRSSPWWGNIDNSKVTPHEDLKNDDRPFNPAPFINQKAILWGANNYASKLPDSNGWLIWDKRLGAENMAENGWPLGEAELAWTNIIGSTRVFRNLWSGILRSSEKGQHYHPTQKPIELMAWCLKFTAGTVLDPYLGSGTTAVACERLKRRWIGIEIEGKYCEIAVKRIESERKQLKLF